jgi:diaminohydroxyphosphoribosylaminopyrimidine deaminase / 5-amino-6-(5-phosphoribosylamino)uracil reductase
MDEKYMQICIDLAQKGFPSAMPNPMVGCVIVYQDKIIGQGFHEKWGSTHAEVNAIASVKDESLLKYSTLYVSLEPCAHFGKTPPCSDLIIEKGIPRVVIGSLDTFSEVNGKGIERLKSAGISVTTSVLKHKCRKLNSRFFTFHEKKRPYVILKWAKSLDEFIAPSNQTEPFWMTGKKSKTLVHKWRSEEQAILIGRKTALLDNPLLTSRGVNGKNPIRIVLDRTLSLTKNLNVFNADAKTIIINELLSDEQHIQVDFSTLIPSILKEFHSRNIQSIIIEGGAQTLNTFITQNVWDEARVFTSKIKLGDGVQSPILKGVKNKNHLIGEDELNYYYNT